MAEFTSGAYSDGTPSSQRPDRTSVCTVFKM